MEYFSTTVVLYIVSIRVVSLYYDFLRERRKHRGGGGGGGGGKVAQEVSQMGFLKYQL